MGGSHFTEAGAPVARPQPAGTPCNHRYPHPETRNTNTTHHQNRPARTRPNRPHPHKQPPHGMGRGKLLVRFVKCVFRVAWVVGVSGFAGSSSGFGIGRVFCGVSCRLGWVLVLVCQAVVTGRVRGFAAASGFWWGGSGLFLAAHMCRYVRLVLEIQCGAHVEQHPPTFREGGAVLDRFDGLSAFQIKSDKDRVVV